MAIRPAQSNPKPTDRSLIIVGGGPAGLTAAYEALRHGVKPLVLEKASLVGGIARTEQYKGYHFDMGGHRFFTKSPEVDRMWHDVLGGDFLKRPRLSRIFYKSKFFNYPLKPMNALLGLGPVESVLILVSYVRWRLFPHHPEDTFEQWVTNRFGRRLFRTFFKTYTEKVWGISCSELKAEWAAQRIKDLSLKAAVLGMFFKPRKTIKTLIDSFDYPRRGPGMLWEAVRNKIEEGGGEVRLNTDVVSICRRGSTIESIVVDRNGVREELFADDFVTSMPVTEFVKKLDPPAPEEVARASGTLKYRDFLTVCLIVDQPNLFPDNWIYLHDAQVQVGRLQNFKNWSPEMVPDQSKTSLGMEYFCNEGDALWSMTDADLVELAKRELETVGLAKARDVEDGCVFRVPKSYPVYDSDYTKYLGVVREYMDTLANCATVGRNGLHRYNNQDHSMLTGMYAVRGLLLGEKHDLWSVNADKDYHEEARKPASAAEFSDADAEAELSAIFARVDRVAMALSLGAVCGIALLLVTLVIVLRGGAVVGPNLSLLAEFFPGYEVTVGGSIIGGIYGFLTGFLTGYAIAVTRNVVTFLYWALVRRHAERSMIRRLLDYV